MNVGRIASSQERVAVTAVSNTRPVESKKTDFKQEETTKFGSGNRQVLSSADQEPITTQENYAEEEIFQAIEKANESFKGQNARFEYSIHEGTKRIMIKVVDPASEEVIKEIPAEKILDMVAKMWEISGIFIDEKR